MKISDLQKEARAIAKEKGWHDTSRLVGELIALCHSELSEALEIELADLIIRVCDMAELLGIDLEAAIEVKMEYNKTRSYRHGGKKL